jgi:hypothetical protein
MTRHLMTVTLADDTVIRWTDHTADVNVFRGATITAGVNDKIDFSFSGARVATIAPGTYSTSENFLAAVKAALDGVIVLTQVVTVTAGVNDQVGWHLKGNAYNTTLPAGRYTGPQLGAALVAAMNAVSPDSFGYSWSAGDKKLTVTCVAGAGAGWGPYPAAPQSVWVTAGFPDVYVEEAVSCIAQTQPVWDTHAVWTVSLGSDGHVTISDGADGAFSLLFATGANAATSARTVLGFGTVDTVSGSSATASGYPAGSETFTASASGTAPAIEVGKITETSGTEIGECSVTLFCGATAQINGVRLPLAVTNNVLDGARAKIEQVFGTSSLILDFGTLHLFEGVVAEANPTSTQVELSLVTGLEELTAPLPKTPIQPPCTATVFDSQCSLSKAAYTVTGAVTGGDETTITSGRTEADGWFLDGVITFTSGQNAGLERGVRSYSNTGGTFFFDEPLPVACAVGDTFSVYPGCNKRIADPNGCAKFNNRVHFRGFPYLPTTEAEKAGGWLTHTYTRVSGRAPPDPAKREATTEYLPIVYGRRKVSAIPLYRHYAPGNYLTAHHDLIEAVCEGPISGTRSIWWGNAAAFRDSVAHYGTAVLGTRPTQAAWTRTSGRDPAAFTAYPGTAHLRFENLDTYYVGGDRGCQVEVDGFLAGTGDPTTGDADPAQIIQDLLTDTAYGAGFSWPVNTTTGTDYAASSSYARYVSLAELWLSPLLDSPRPTLDWLQEILDSTNASCRWKEGTLQIVPLGDQEIVTEGGSYLPDVTRQYALTETDLLPFDGDDPISVDRTAREEIFNVCPVEFTERTSTACIDHYDELGNFVAGDPSQMYKPRTVEDGEPVDVGRNGLRRADSVSLPMICLDTVATTISRIKAQRSAKARNKYKFKLGWRFALLEPLDYVTISDTLFGFSSRPVRILTIERDPGDQTLTIEAEDAPLGASHAVGHVTQSSEASPTQWTDSNSVAPSLGYIEARIAATATTTWTKVDAPVSAGWNGACWSRTRWVMVGSYNGCMTSDDPSGLSGWTARTVGTGTWQAVAANGSGTVVAVGLASKGSVSADDGATWAAFTMPAGDYWDVQWDTVNSQFIAVGTVTAYSPTGANGTWTVGAAPPTGYTLTSVAVKGSTTVAVGMQLVGGVILRSVDGCRTWSHTTYHADEFWKSVAGSGSKFIVVGTVSQIRQSSDDGVSWLDADAVSLPSSFHCIGTDGYIFAAANQDSVPQPIFVTLDCGSTWTQRTTPKVGGDGLCVFNRLVFNGYCWLACTTHTYVSKVVVSNPRVF